MGLGSKTDLFANYQKSQEQIGQAQKNPFANLNIQPISVPQRKQENIQKEKDIQKQVRVSQNKLTERRKEQENAVQSIDDFMIQTKTRVTANGRTLKTSKNGNTYVYEDIYDHKNDVKIDKKESVKYLLSLPKNFKAYLESVAKSERTSLNQLILRAIRLYIQANS